MLLLTRQLLQIQQAGTTGTVLIFFKNTVISIMVLIKSSAQPMIGTEVTEHELAEDTTDASAALELISRLRNREQDRIDKLGFLAHSG